MCQPICQCGSWPEDLALIVVDLDPLDELTDVALAKGVVFGMEPFDRSGRESGEIRVREQATGNLPLTIAGSYGTHVLFTLILEAVEGLAQKVVIFDDALGDGVIEALDLLLRGLKLLTQLLQVQRLLLGIVAGAVDQGCEQLPDPVRCKDPALQLAENDVVELTHGDVPSLAGGRALVHPVVARVVAVAACAR